MTQPFLGIFREPEYSPGRHTNNDAIILRLVGQALERLGVSVTLATLEEARSLRENVALVFSMLQGPKAVAEITGWRDEGTLVLNDPHASRRTYRDVLCRMMKDADISFPQTITLSTQNPDNLSDAEVLIGDSGAWLKRGDVHAMQAGDVSKIESASELPKALERLAERGIPQAALQPNIEGDEVKFYAVSNGRLFWPYYPRECQGYPFDEKELAALAARAARTVGVSIYGGDAIISPDGRITLIDLNDWPSFAPCRGAAASAIAHYLKDTHHALQHDRTPSAQR